MAKTYAQKLIDIINESEPYMVGAPGHGDPWYRKHGKIKPEDEEKVKAYKVATTASKNEVKKEISNEVLGALKQAGLTVKRKTPTFMMIDAGDYSFTINIDNIKNKRNPVKAPKILGYDR